MKRVLVVALLCLASTFFLSVSVKAQPPQWVSLDYDKYEFLIQDISDDVCLMVPNPPSMKMISPDDYISGSDSTPDKCDQSKFFGWVIVSIIIPICFIAILLCVSCCCCPCIYGLLHKQLKFFDKSNVQGTNTCHILTLVILFAGLMAGGTVVIIATERTSEFIWETKAIFDQNPNYAIDTVYAVNAALETLPLTNTTEAQTTRTEAMNIAYKLRSTGQSEITDKLDGLSSLVQTIMDFTVAAVFFVVVFAFIAALIKAPKCAIFIGFLVIILLLLIWVEFSVVFAANNILHKMCSTINRCHFCFAGLYPPNNNGSVNCFKEYCDVPWFQTMSHCSPEASSRFYGLQGLVADAVGTTANATCSSIATICTPSAEILSCAYPNGPCSQAISTTALDAIVLAEVAGTPPTWQTITTLASNGNVSAAIQEQANNAISQFNNMTQYAAQLSSVQSLDCGANNAFIEMDPGGTFDALQKHLCPEIVHPRYDIYEILVTLAIGLMIMGILLPCLTCAVCLDRRYPQRGMTAGDMDDHEDTVSLIGAINATKSPPASRQASIFD